MKEIDRALQERTARSILALIKRRIRGHAPLLIILCGPSHSGKTAFARSLGSRFTVISSDRIREQLGTCFRGSEENGVWNIFEASKRRALKAGRSVVLDACHISKRARWHALKGPNSRYRKICIVFDLPLRTLWERCGETGRVSLREAERMWRVFRDSKPTVKELKRLGFNDVYFVKH